MRLPAGTSWGTPEIDAFLVLYCPEITIHVSTEENPVSL